MNASEPVRNIADPSEVVTPSAARRRLAEDLRRLRRASGLGGKEAGRAIERSEATVSRFESGRYLPRAVDLYGLLDVYEEAKPGLVSSELRERLSAYLVTSHETQWFEPFKDLLTGELLPEHQVHLVEFEMDAAKICAYESDLIPALLQTSAYAGVIAQLFFPRSSKSSQEQLVEFRMARQDMLRRRSPGRAVPSFIINEAALHRRIGSASMMHDQLESIVSQIKAGSEGMDVRILPQSVVIPAALGGPFQIFSEVAGGEAPGVVYLESRSGADYLSNVADVQRFKSYFETLRKAALGPTDSIALIRSTQNSITSD